MMYAQIYAPENSTNSLTRYYTAEQEALPTTYYAARMNVIRFISICSVIWGHCMLGLESRLFPQNDYQFIQSIVLQTGRVGTVMFFLISGFLLSNKIAQFNVISYLRYRLFSLIIPWLIFLTLLVMIQLFDALSLQQIVAGNGRQTLSLVYNLFKGAVFHAAYWFIPVAILSSLILIAFKRYINSLWFGLLLVGITMFYCVNLYHNWIPANHTQSFLGYTLFLWLGTLIKKHINIIGYAMRKLSWAILMPLLIITFLLACREGLKLTHIHSTDPYASLRFSNAVFSILLFMVLLKSESFSWLKYFNPQKNVYGLYLLHSIIINLLMRIIGKLVLTYELAFNLPGLILMQTIFFIMVLTIAYIIVAAIKRSSLRFMVGVRL